jgi:hypothetical protein
VETTPADQRAEAAAAREEAINEAGLDAGCIYALLTRASEEEAIEVLRLMLKEHASWKLAAIENLRLANAYRELIERVLQDKTDENLKEQHGVH